MQRPISITLQNIWKHTQLYLELCPINTTPHFTSLASTPGTTSTCLFRETAGWTLKLAL